MFTGLIEDVGACQWLRRTPQSIQLAISAPHVAKGIGKGDSLAVNGCCLTVTSTRKDALVFDLLEETVRRTNLGDLRPGAPVNLERALAASGRMGGHFVQGHIDDTAEVLNVSEQGPDLRLEFSLPASCAAYVAFKGSVAVNGVSLTVAEAGTGSFVVWIIPHTRTATNLGILEPRDRVNLETDILAKYTERILAGRSA
jgi:riboflavin synthase